MSDPFAAGASVADPLAHDDHAPTDTPSDSDRPTAPIRLGKNGLNETARGLVLAVSLAIHQTLARTEPEQDAGLWLMEEAEAASIGDPLAAIAQRRAGGAVVDADLADLIKAGTAAVGYFATNTIRAVKLRLFLRRARRVGTTEPQEGTAS